MTCIHCRGEMKRGAAPFHIGRKGCHLMLDEVSAWLCEQCGEAYFEEKVEEFRRNESPYIMANSTFIDDIIEPAETRDRLIVTLEVLLSKRKIPKGKTHHGNIPL